MANIKVSEMTEATAFDDGDYTMIVQANQNKKISKENILGDIEDDISTINSNIGNLSNLETDDKSSVVNSINELKNAEIYSTNEIKTNKVWIDGKPIYRKVINFGSLPNASSKEVNSNISDLDNIVKLIGVATAQDKTTYCLPYVSTTSSNYFIDLTFTSSQTVRIRTLVDRSSMNAYVTLEYTKTTD